MILLPPPLLPGDSVAILSPASKIDPAHIRAASEVLSSMGFNPVVMPHAEGESGSFSGTAQERLADFTAALADPSIKAILCSRGGYGAVHLLEELNSLPSNQFHKWLIGFSDITALHGLWRRKGVASLHGAMAKYIGQGPELFPCFAEEMGILTGDASTHTATYLPHPSNIEGHATGPVIGGNLAVLGGLIGTPYFTIPPGAILFIEDIAEPIYKVERILWQLRLAGAFEQISGLMVGQFTDYRPSADHPSMEAMLTRFFEPYSFPRAFNLPIGHIEENRPLLLGLPATLTVEPERVSISYA